MLISSTLNPSYKSTIHFVVVHYENERILVPTDTYPKYSDIIDFVQRQWDVKSTQLVLETNELDICRGDWVKIHEESWPGLKDVVGNVHVKQHPPFAARIPSNMVETDGVKITSNTTKPLLPRSKSVSVKAEDHRQRTESADESEVEHQMTSDIPSTPASTADEDTDDPANTTVLPPSPTKGDTLNLFGETGGKSESTKKPVVKEEKRDTPPVTQKLPSSSSKKFTPSTLISTPAATSKFHPAVTPTPARPVSPTKEKSEAPEDPDRVLILVEIPGSHEARPFRIRRDYTVHSVLKGVSKVFDFDYTRATLRKVHRDPGEPYIDEDEEELETTELERTETMRSLGIRNKQRFIVDIEEDEED